MEPVSAMHIENKDLINIVILEDEPAHAEAVSRALAPHSDCNVKIVYSLADFHSMDFVPDIVIADINLPDGTAFSLLKGDIEDQPWPLLIMTSYGDEETAVKAIKSGALDYIVKSPENFIKIDHVIKRNLREWRNIHKRKEFEKNYRFLFETMAQGVIYHDIQGRIISANPAAEKILGVSLEEMQDVSSKNIGWKSIHEDGSPFPRGEHPAMKALQEGIHVRDTVMGVYNAKNKQYSWILINAIPQFRDNEKDPYQVFTTFTEITELRNTLLELQKAKEKAEESDRLKSAFMANMSHEIRTPMNGILGFADLLKNPGLSGASQKKYIEVIEMSGKRMLNIINDLIDISKIEAGQIEIFKESVNVPDLLNELLLLFAPEGAKKGLTLKINLQIPRKAYYVETDRTKLAQIITNLLKNAMKFTDSGGNIELGAKSGGKSNLVIYVRDTGMGIRKELQEKIFERFRQGDINDAHEGVGLGLAISKAYVELLGGHINVESELGKGSVFSFTIPEDQGSGNPANAAGEYGNPVDLIPVMNILVAEDDDISYFLLRESLKNRNINTIHATNGLEAIHLVQAHPEINLVLMDLKMPVLNGVDATRKIKEIFPSLPVIAQSAFFNRKEIEKSFEAGCDDYITKPIDIKTLFEKITAVSKMKI
jgi:PAS domain S-box-containing protein